MNSPMHINTPLLQSRSINERLGANVWFKVDALQPCGSFKIRGIGLKCQRDAEAGKDRFVSSSGGNAGLAAAYAGRKLAKPVIVVVPSSTSERAKNLLAEQGAEIIVHGANWNAAHAHALELLQPTDSYIHPFDDAVLWEGHASIISEILNAGITPKRIVVSVGGGGLLCGVVKGLADAGLSDCEIFAVETIGADSLYQSVQQKSLVELTSISSIATSLGARKVSETAFRHALTRNVHSMVVSDAQAVSACINFANDFRILVEPACGAALAMVYSGKPELLAGSDTVVVACGGVGVTFQQLMQWSSVS